MKHYRYRLDDPRVSYIDLPHSSAEDIAKLHTLVEQGNVILVSAGARFRCEGAAAVTRLPLDRLPGTPYGAWRWTGDDPEQRDLWGAYPTLRQVFEVARALAETPGEMPADMALPFENEYEGTPDDAPGASVVVAALVGQEARASAAIDNREDPNSLVTMVYEPAAPEAQVDGPQGLIEDECSPDEDGDPESEPADDRPVTVAHLDAPTSYGAGVDAAVERGENVSAPSPRKRKTTLPGLLDGAKVGAAIRSLRETLHMERNDLAEAVGLPKWQLEKLEAGEVENPRIELCQQIADALGVPLAQITRLPA